MSHDKVYDALPKRLHNKVEVFSASEIGQKYLYHISTKPNIRRFIPEVSRRTMNIEDRSIPRISTSAHLTGAFSASQIIETEFEQAENALEILQGDGGSCTVRDPGTRTDLQIRIRKTSKRLPLARRFKEQVYE